MRSSLVAALLIAVALAGCTSDGDEVASNRPAELAIQAPTWAVGDHWSFTNSGSDGQQSSMDLVVTGEDGGDWIVDTNEPTVALFHAREPISYLGEIRKSDLAGSQGNDRVKYFDFPLQANKTWTTTWDGITATLQVKHIEEGRAHIEATANGKRFADYEYSEDRRFFSCIDFYDENGTQAFRMETTAHGSDFSGTVYRYQVHDDMTFHASGAAREHHELVLPDDATEMWLHSIADCGSAQAGHVGSIVTHRAPDEPFLPQWVTPTQEMVHNTGMVCEEGQMDVAEDTVDVDHERIYDLEYGAAAQGGTIDVIIQPRVLESIMVE